MQTRYLGSLLAVIETGSIAAAARQQNLTPAAVSQRIAALEQDLGCELLIRSAKSAWPSPICLGLLDDIHSLLQAEARMRARSSAGSVAGRLRVGAISTSLVEIIPPILTRLRETAPELELTVRPGSSADLFERVRNRNLDLALIVRPAFSVAKDVEMRTIRREPLMLVTPPDCSATSLEEAFARWPLIRYDAASWGGRLVSDYLAQTQLAPSIYCDLDGPEAIQLLVARGQGVAILPKWSKDFHGTVVPGGEAFAREVVCIFQADARMHPIIAHVLKIVEEITPNL